MLSLLNKILDRLSVVLGALMGAQLPEFIQQYKQRLAGHVAELQKIRDSLENLAKQSGTNLDQYIQKFLTNQDPDFASQGDFMKGILTRLDQLEGALNDLMTNGGWKQPFIFVKGIQWDIAQSAFSDFVPGLSLNLEGIIYTLLGAVIGYSCYHLIASGLRLLHFPGSFFGWTAGNKLNREEMI